MNIVIVGTGYVGLVTGTCLAEAGLHVTCIDVDANKVADLQRGILPIHEPGLAEIMHRNVAAGRLQFATDLSAHLRGVDAVFICVGTPPNEDGTADLQHVLGVASSIGDCLEDYAVVVTKSTVPVGTAALVREAIASRLAERGVEVDFDVASNPEFLKEGVAIADFQAPDRIVVGIDSARARTILERVYRSFVLNGHPIQFMDIASAELTKYAANAMLALRISFMNLMSQVCEEFGADIGAIRQGIAADRRIGSQFLYAGIGYGGSCFPKDVRALARSGAAVGIDMGLLDAVEAINDRQKLRLLTVLEREFESLKGLKVALWGLAFKPNTDDVREAPALEIIRGLTNAGASVTAYDPVAMASAKRSIGDLCHYAADAYAATDDADVLILATEWNEFRNPEPEELAKRMRGRLVLDGRNVLDPGQLAERGFRYHSIGRRPVQPTAST